jgi:probable F420-dependent oxidoreductase
MRAQRPFRFATDTIAKTRAELLDQIRTMEEIGFSTLIGGEHPSQGGLGQVSTLAATAMATTSLHVSSQVFANDFWNPVMLAREAATIDMLCEGRLEFGMGTGWYRPDYAQMGFSFDPPDVRVSRLIEAIQVVKGLFAGDPFTFEGTYYTIRDHTGLKSVQRPHPRFFIGGAGRRMLTLAAREADIVGLNIGTTPQGGLDFATMTAEALASKIAWVKQAAGERFEELELHILLLAVIITNDRRQAAAKLLEDLQADPFSDADLSVEQILESPYLLVGTVDEMIADLIARRQRYGISYVAVFGDSMMPFCQVVSRLAGT